MAAKGPRDHRLLDALEAMPGQRVELTLWRVCIEGRDPTSCSAPAGRWDDGTFDVLYTAREADGAIAEMYFHVRRGLPVIPSKVTFRLHELRVRFDALLDLSDRKTIGVLGIDPARYGSLDYGRHPEEYSRTREIGDAAHLLDFDGLQVPSARWDGANVVIFCDRVRPEQVIVVGDHGAIDWALWEDRQPGSR
jgi:RES domain-containing protein